jgi:hypothetical protein
MQITLFPTILMSIKKTRLTGGKTTPGIVFKKKDFLTQVEKIPEPLSHSYDLCFGVG